MLLRKRRSPWVQSPALRERKAANNPKTECPISPYKDIFPHERCCSPVRPQGCCLVLDEFLLETAKTTGLHRSWRITLGKSIIRRSSTEGRSRPSVQQRGSSGRLRSCTAWQGPEGKSLLIHRTKQVSSSARLQRGWQGSHHTAYPRRLLMEVGRRWDHSFKCLCPRQWRRDADLALPSVANQSQQEAARSLLYRNRHWGWGWGWEGT